MEATINKDTLRLSGEVKGIFDKYELTNEERKGILNVRSATKYNQFMEKAVDEIQDLLFNKNRLTIKEAGNLMNYLAEIV